MKISPKQSPSYRWLIASLHSRLFCCLLGTFGVLLVFFAVFSEGDTF